MMLMIQSCWFMSLIVLSFCTASICSTSGANKVGNLNYGDTECLTIRFYASIKGIPVDSIITPYPPLTLQEINQKLASYPGNGLLLKLKNEAQNAENQCLLIAELRNMLADKDLILPGLLLSETTSRGWNREGLKRVFDESSRNHIYEDFKLDDDNKYISSEDLAKYIVKGVRYS
ncbi:uncharacterized protein LOC111045735 [Nilaparvata lugens]|uniref:uncharacterized protein LOC111045735 n=1 Tax=Nilaparvata lugens TaxID=108931 RepID=UPI00193E9103|nr:uncharacterized protein LOC111045735 [Nilaparvata lugens]XP_039278639.1 uncharacterized protein LOC111045735 [Nilaparvata lugens]XP_039278640.1 uncharacterized protein LOC111045735 [Nilaparvata lugens]XP_039278641.1 uncharacterized protein LOC111045735 [Nilaparvata lugens]